jgi:homoserine O-acetyltransferase
MHFIAVSLAVLGAIPSIVAHTGRNSSWLTPDHGTAVLSNFTFDSGETLQELNIHYQTLGKLKVHADGTNNAVLVLHGTTESSNQFLNPTSQACSSIPDSFSTPSNTT